MDQKSIQDQVNDMEAALAKLKAQLPKAPKPYCPNCSCPSCFDKSYPGPGPFSIPKTHGLSCGCMLCAIKETNARCSPWCNCADCLFKSQLKQYGSHGGMCACQQCVPNVYL